MPPAEEQRAKQRALWAQQLADFSRAIRKTGKFPDVAEADLAAGLKTFSAALDGLSFSGASAQVGQNLFQRLGAQYSSVPTLGTPPSDPMKGQRVQTMFNLLDRAASPLAAQGGRRYAVGLDINAQFLACSATVALGIGEASEIAGRRITDNWAEVLKRPGYVQLAAPVEIGPGCVLSEGDWIANPTADYLMRRDGVLPVTRGYQWMQSRRWLKLWTDRMRTARASLIGRDDLPSLLALAAVKAVYAAFLGGWLNSGEDANNYNKTDTLRPDWMHMIHSTARVNMLRALTKATVAPFATHADAAYFLTDDVMDPRGLTLSTQPGKWKVYRLGTASAPVTIQSGKRYVNTTLADQIDRGSVGNISKVMTALDSQYRGVHA